MTRVHRPRRCSVGVIWCLLAVVVLLGSCSADRGESAKRDVTMSTTNSGGFVPRSSSSVLGVGEHRRSAGCDAGGSPGTSEVHLDDSGEDRWYLQHVPIGYDPAVELPLVIDIHGYGEGARLHSTISGLGPYGDAHGFVTVTPNGQGNPVHWDTSIGSADVAWLGAVMNQVESDLCIDLARVYAAGFSNGAFMVSTLACVYGDRIGAVAPVAGMRDVPGCVFSRSMPVVSFHGTSDHFVEYNGGMGAAAAQLIAPDGSGRTLGDLVGSQSPNNEITAGSMDESLPEIVEAWAERNYCDTNPSEMAVANDVTLISFACPAGDDVELYRVTDGGHAWPGSQGSAALAAITGPTTMSIDATRIMWEFFKSHPLHQ